MITEKIFSIGVATISKRKTNFSEKDLFWGHFVHHEPTWIILGLNLGEARY
jgi:hypothetical protein